MTTQRLPSRSQSNLRYDIDTAGAVRLVSSTSLVVGNIQGRVTGTMSTTTEEAEGILNGGCLALQMGILPVNVPANADVVLEGVA